MQEVLLLHFETRHISGIMADSELDSAGRVVQLLTGTVDSSLQSVWTSSESQIASYSMVTKGFYLGLNWSWLEADHSPPNGAEVKKVKLHLQSPRCLCGLHKDNFTFHCCIL